MSRRKDETKRRFRIARLEERNAGTSFFDHQDHGGHDVRGGVVATSAANTPGELTSTGLAVIDPVRIAAHTPGHVSTERTKRR